ncbi:phosphomannomutase [Desulfocucumis palustris]|uniref:Phosphomannomutase n=1 Tax=Desulfocucumis palustris TaxID=1898651 RepID=A0A2L2X7R3_9FIRM|nr:phosphomannomutase/phosphoglucomutase [Desulfocucumis palustris]GBF31944.1 phosphomannomutase [Desulfocucumis palustris]
MGIFKACDIRGIYSQELTDRDAYDLGRAAGKLAAGQTALVAGDVRLSTQGLKTALCAGLAAAGYRVTDLGIVTTPIFYYAGHHIDNDVGIMVTASHNPPEYNGFKLLIKNRPINNQELVFLEKTMANGDYITGAAAGGYRRDGSWTSRYAEHLLNRFQPGKLKVVLDCGNGSCSLIAPGLLNSLGYRVVELFCTPDGSFPNRSPNPAAPENIAALCRRVPAEGASVGIAYDGDGDRVAFVDETGQPIANDRILTLLARYLLEMEKGAVVYDSKCSLVVPEEVARMHGVPLMARSGHGFVGAAFLESNALVAGELSGHFFWRDLQFDDGVYSSLVLLELLQKSNTPLSQMDGTIPKYLITPDIRIPFQGDPGELVNQAAQRLSQYPISRLDGVRVEFPDCWGMIRPSITEPILTLRFEGKTRDKLTFIMDLILQELPSEYQNKAYEVLRTMIS